MVARQIRDIGTPILLMIRQRLLTEKESLTPLLCCLATAGLQLLRILSPPLLRMVSQNNEALIVRRSSHY
jgi:hypothetical protein